MLITVKQSKLVLGRTVYRSGDVFECRDAEAKLLVAGGMATKSPPGAKATKGSPTPPTTGMSAKAGTLPASPEAPASRVGPKRKAEAESPEAKPIGAMTMTQPLASRPAPVVATPATTPKV